MKESYACLLTCPSPALHPEICKWATPRLRQSTRTFAPLWCPHILDLSLRIFSHLVAISWRTCTEYPLVPHKVHIMMNLKNNSYLQVNYYIFFRVVFLYLFISIMFQTFLPNFLSSYSKMFNSFGVEVKIFLKVCPSFSVERKWAKIEIERNVNEEHNSHCTNVVLLTLDCCSRITKTLFYGSSFSSISVVCTLKKVLHVRICFLCQNLHVLLLANAFFIFHQCCSTNSRINEAAWQKWDKERKNYIESLLNSKTRSFPLYQNRTTTIQVFFCYLVRVK